MAGQFPRDNPIPAHYWISTAWTEGTLTNHICRICSALNKLPSSCNDEIASRTGAAVTLQCILSAGLTVTLCIYLFHYVPMRDQLHDLYVLW